MTTFKHEDVFDEPLSSDRLANMRIPLKNLVYIIGLPYEISKPEILNSPEYLSQYGKIKKIVINKCDNKQRTAKFGTCSAYITFQNEKEAALAIYALDEFPIKDKILRAFYGTTKYCSFFLRGGICINENCAYLHKIEENWDQKFDEKQKITLSFLCKWIEDYRKLSRKINVSPSFPEVNLIIRSIESFLEQKNPKRQKKPDPKVIKTLDIINIRQEKKCKNEEEEGRREERGGERRDKVVREDGRRNEEEERRRGNGQNEEGREEEGIREIKDEERRGEERISEEEERREGRREERGSENDELRGREGSERQDESWEKKRKEDEREESIEKKIINSLLRSAIIKKIKNSRFSFAHPNEHRQLTMVQEVEKMIVSWIEECRRDEKEE